MLQKKQELMSFEVGAWLMLLGFFGLAGSAALLGNFIEVDSELAKVVRPLAAIGVLVFSGAALVMLFQGLHLWNQGWDGPISQMDPSAAGRNAARARGKGGIVLLAIQFFPQFLVFGYGFILWTVRPVIKGSCMVLGLLNRHSDT